MSGVRSAMHSDHDLARLAARVGRHLLDSRRGLATAESCTGGWIAKAITDIAGSSQWFIEGFVTYSNESKAGRLGVSRTVLEKEGAVSEATARAMAVGALKRTGAQLSVAVTGIAGPGGAVAGGNRLAGLGRAAWAHNACCRATEALSWRPRSGAPQDRARGASGAARYTVVDT
jgi:nicotinamide-nucleotide amidase